MCLRLYIMDGFSYTPAPRDTAKRVVEDRWRRDNRTLDLTVRGSSMGESLPDGSTVRICLQGRPVLHRGCLVYIRRREERLIHRCVLAVGPFVIEKGDDNPYYGVSLRRDIIGIGDLLECGTPSTDDQARDNRKGQHGWEVLSRNKDRS